MKREDYLKQRRLQGLDSRIRRAEYQITRGRMQIAGMQKTFERNKSRHDEAVKRIELRLKSAEAQIDSMKSQKALIS
tara:strand:+ start:451 stop:681 length:231 start_codon:yes stop_codon:yes gene_type:complete